MSGSESVEEKTAASLELNRLYWDTDESVSEISNRLGVSRRALYDMVEPSSAGVACVDCGGELVYQNRSAKAAGVARCLMCGAERTTDEEMSHEDVGTIPPYNAGWPASPSATDETRERAATIAGFAIAGAVIGAIATILVRRKR